MENATNTLNNEALDTLGYLIDKFNLTLEVSSAQIKDFSIQLANKIVRWELIESIIYALVHLCIMLAMVFIIKKLKDISIKKIIEIEAFKNDKELIRVMAKIVCYIISLFMITVILGEIYDIVMCIAFPEKIILEFIGKYI